MVECNTAYEGQRNTTAKHMSTLEAHGWKKYFRVDLMDAEGPDLELSIPEGKVIQKNFVGKNMKNYDSILVLSHFKGHPMGGYGGALKQLAIGCASSYGKAYVHGAGDPEKIWTSDHDSFLESNDLSSCHNSHSFHHLLGRLYQRNYRKERRHELCQKYY